MKFTIESKFNIGEQVYQIKKGNKRIECDYCNGRCVFLIEDKTIKCPECRGSGTKPTSERIYFVNDTPFIITEIRGRLNTQTLTPEISYKISNKNNISNCHFTAYIAVETLRTKSGEIFVTKDEAQAECDKRNHVVKEDNTLCQN